MSLSTINLFSGPPSSYCIPDDQNEGFSNQEPSIFGVAYADLCQFIDTLVGTSAVIGSILVFFWRFGLWKERRKS